MDKYNEGFFINHHDFEHLQYYILALYRHSSSIEDLRRDLPDEIIKAEERASKALRERIYAAHDSIKNMNEDVDRIYNIAIVLKQILSKIESYAPPKGEAQLATPPIQP